MFHHTRLAFVAVIMSLLATAGCGGGAPASAPAAGSAPAFSQKDLVVGTGPTPKKGDLVYVTYTGWLYDASKPDQKGMEFDSSIEPFEFSLGVGQVIPGWDKGFDNMKVGGKRRLVIPPALAYGAEGTPGGPIPPNATLVFEMELVDITPV